MLKPKVVIIRPMALRGGKRPIVALSPSAVMGTSTAKRVKSASFLSGPTRPSLSPTSLIATSSRKLSPTTSAAEDHVVETTTSTRRPEKPVIPARAIPKAATPPQPLQKASPAKQARAVTATSMMLIRMKSATMVERKAAAAIVVRSHRPARVAHPAAAVHPAAAAPEQAALRVEVAAALESGDRGAAL